MKNSFPFLLFLAHN